MADDGVGGTVAVELADARTDDHGHSQSRHAADSVHDARSGKVAVALSESEHWCPTARASHRPRPSCHNSG